MRSPVGFGAPVFVTGGPLNAALADAAALRALSQGWTQHVGTCVSEHPGTATEALAGRAGWSPIRITQLLLELLLTREPVHQRACSLTSRFVLSLL